MTKGIVKTRNGQKHDCSERCYASMFGGDYYYRTGRRSYCLSCAVRRGLVVIQKRGKPEFWWRSYSVKDNYPKTKGVPPCSTKKSSKK